MGYPQMVLQAALADSQRFSIPHLTFEAVFPVVRALPRVLVAAVAAVLPADLLVLVVVVVAVAGEQALLVTRAVVVVPVTQEQLALMVTLARLARVQLLVIPVLAAELERQAM
jgi:hypothetical protein